MKSRQAIVETISNQVDEIIKKYAVKSVTRKIRTRANNTILSWNVFLTDSSLLTELCNDLQESFKMLLSSINGEIIRYEGIQGEIWDRHYNQFVVLDAWIHEIYWYDPEIFGYIRILHEQDKFSHEKEWVSVDVDLIADSAWFLD